MKSTDTVGLGVGGSSDIFRSGIITTIKLDGTNYLEWAQSAKMAIGARGKLRYLTGEEKKPDTDSSRWV